MGKSSNSWGCNDIIRIFHQWTMVIQHDLTWFNQQHVGKLANELMGRSEITGIFSYRMYCQQCDIWVCLKKCMVRLQVAIGQFCPLIFRHPYNTISCYLCACVLKTPEHDWRQWYQPFWLRNIADVTSINNLFVYLTKWVMHTSRIKTNNWMETKHIEISWNIIKYQDPICEAIFPDPIFGGSCCFRECQQIGCCGQRG